MHPSYALFLIPLRLHDKSEQTGEKGIKIKLKEENNNPWHDISNVKPIDEECGNTRLAIGGIRCSSVAMEYETARGWKIKMAGKTRRKGFVLKGGQEGDVRFYR